MPDAPQHTAMRFVLILAGIFAVLSIGLLLYELFPQVSKMFSPEPSERAPATLQERERVLERLNSNPDGTPIVVSQEAVSQRQQLLAQLNPQQRAGQMSATSSASRTPPIQQADVSARLKALQNLNAK